MFRNRRPGFSGKGNPPARIRARVGFPGCVWSGCDGLSGLFRGLGCFVSGDVSGAAFKLGGDLEDLGGAFTFGAFGFGEVRESLVGFLSEREAAFNAINDWPDDTLFFKGNDAADGSPRGLLAPCLGDQSGKCQDGGSGVV